MAVQKINIESFITASSNAIIIDVRSPAEYDHAHIPSALNLPLFDNEERALIGTTYRSEEHTSELQSH